MADEGSKSMTAQTKGRIRHVALSVKDPWETAEFYKQAVGLQEVMELDGPLAEGVFLTDGVVNLADGYEVKHTDLNGIIFDIAAHGWAGSQKDPGSEDNVANGNPQRRLAKFDERRTRAKAKFAAMRGKKFPQAAE
jgi:catechol 2,3-dioxygenase-like lactoylglutathione lyase family enzyme